MENATPPSRRAWRWAAPPALLLASVAVYACTSAQASEGERADGAAPVQDAAQVGFRNAVSGPPPGWTGPVFQLSADYPVSALAKCAESTCPWLYRQVDFASTTQPEWQGEWAEYMNDIFRYVREGQTLSPQGWNAQVAGETRWFHVPWMAYDSVHGREFVHGMTNERATDLSDFFPPGRGRTTLHAGRVPGAANGVTTMELPKGQHTLRGASDTTRQFESWAVGFYNPWGAYAIGQAIPRSSGVPQTVQLPNGSQGARGMPFPEGTVVAKILFTTATPRDVSYLRGSPAWIADRHVQTGPSTYSNARRPDTVHLAQMDVAVRDDRSPTGWVYGTFAYNGRLLGASPWDRMAPVGLQWGSDPDAWPAVASRARPVTQSAIAPISIPQHLGCNDRLAGPIDNPKSSCMSCHQGAYAPAPVGTRGSYGRNIPPIFGFTNICVRNGTTPDSTDLMNRQYVQNVRFPQDYPAFPGVSGPTINLDTSLQLQVAFLQYANWLAAQQS